MFRFLNHFFSQDITVGALPTLYAAVGPDVKGGDYYGPEGWKEMRGYPKKVESNELSHDEENARRLWEISEASTGVKFALDKKVSGFASKARDHNLGRERRI